MDILGFIILMAIGGVAFIVLWASVMVAIFI